MQSKYHDEPKYWSLSDADYAKIVAEREGPITLTPNTIRFTSSTFGDYLTYPYPVGVGAVIICVKEGLGGYKPVGLCLTHQIYREKLEGLVKEYPEAESFVLVPVRPEEYVTVPARPFLAKNQDPVRPTLDEQVKAAMDRHRKNEAAGKYIGKGDPVAKAE